MRSSFCAAVLTLTTAAWLAACDDSLDIVPVDGGVDQRAVDGHIEGDKGGPTPDSAQDALPEDATKPDTLAPDTAPPDTLALDAAPPDTQAPDIMAPDTMAPDVLSPPDQCVATTEICDGKDNDCNSQIDEPFGNKGQPCTAGVGQCQASGVYVCAANGLATECDATPTIPGVEACRTSQDEDCDGQKDEICGPKHDYAVVTNLGSWRAKRGLVVGRNKAGVYIISSTAAFPSCSEPLMITAEGATPPHSVQCVNNNYHVTFSGPLGIAAQAFHAVRPATSSEVWAVVEDVACPNGICVPTDSQGKPKVNLASSTGVFEIQHAACNNVNQPVFVTIRGSASGWGIGRANGNNNSCNVRTFNLNGTLKKLPFSVWLPSMTQNAFVTGTKTGGIAASNDFNDQKARWTLQQHSDTFNNFLYFSTSFDAWANPSAVLAAPRLSANLVVAGVDSTSAVVRVTTYGAVSIPPVPIAEPIYVLYVQ